MFAYCLNNPISNVDSSGSIPMRVKLYSDCGISTSVSSSTTNSLSVIGSSQEHSNDYVNPKKIPNPKSGYVPPKKIRIHKKLKTLMVLVGDGQQMTVEFGFQIITWTVAQGG